MDKIGIAQLSRTSPRDPFAGFSRDPFAGFSRNYFAGFSRNYFAGFSRVTTTTTIKRMDMHA